MATQRSYRRQWLRAHSRYERAALNRLLPVFIEWGAQIPWEDLTPSNYVLKIGLNVEIETMERAYFNIYMDVGRAHGEMVGRDINTQLKEFTLTKFNELFGMNILQWMQQFIGQNITSVRQTFIDDIVRIIGTSLQEGEDMRQITTRLQTAIRQPNFYRWQAERIARTETTTAANYGASIASEVSGFIMQKIWISVLDSRTRRPPKEEFDHWTMDGVRVAQTAPFIVSGEALDFPGDQQGGSAGNVINCRCTMAIVPFRDRNGNLVRTA